MNDSPPSDGQLARYLAGELPAEDCARVDGWLATNPSHRAELERVRGALPAGATGARWNTDAAWARVDGQLSSETPVVPLRPREAGTNRPVPRAWYLQPVLRAAAAIILMAGIGYLWRVRANSAVVAEARYATGVGRSRSIVLPDSTVVALGPSSTLRVLAGYGSRERIVQLTGEAWFRVQHDATRPFSVRTFNTVTQDIGTEFTVRALAGDSTVRVIVYEGAATLRHVDTSAERAVLLRAHEVGVVAGSGEAQRVAVDSSATPLWREGQLAFDQATLQDVMTELGRWYPVVVMPLDSTLRLRRVSATLPARDLAESLTILRLALGLAIEQRGDTLVIR